jgi:hypothetical protein
MRRHIAILSLAFCTLAVGASQAGAQESVEPVYRYVYFSDATHSVQVGIAQGKCSWSGVRYTLTGNHSPYFDKTLSHYCGSHPEPIQG